ncbi:MAG: hypothetical protein GY853_00965 [PVC group bacterium]|nr:hypothetical protein [PVC group bacterium]
MIEKALKLWKDGHSLKEISKKLKVAVPSLILEIHKNKMESQFQRETREDNDE